MLLTIEQGKEKKWNIRSKDASSSQAVAKIASELHLHTVVAQLLYDRGYETPEAARQFVRMETEMLCNPMQLKDIEKALDRIELAVAQKHKILIYGDYDVDGVTSVCTLFLYLKSVGADVQYYIPSRTGEGHGVSCSSIEKFAQEGVKLIITVDTGITAIEEVDFAKTVGVDFIITDHHECHGQLPAARAVVNPHRPDCPYPFKELAGVGVVFKLICALHCRISRKPMIECVRDVMDNYGDLVAIGTIADVMPIIGENKLIVARGLQMLQKTDRVGIIALMEAAAMTNVRKIGGGTVYKKKPKINSAYIGYTLAPRINAAGRIRNASIAVELFLTNDYGVADELALILCEANKERQAEENRIMQEAFAIIEEKHDFENEPVIVLESDSWHHGVIGIVSSRITEKYGLPSILISFDGCDPDAHSFEDMGKGSGRSVHGLNLVEALFSCSELLPKFGGHELAAGLSIRRGDVPAFCKAVNAYAKEKLSASPIETVVEADGEITLSDVNMTVATDLQLLEPYGAGNPMPTFVIRNLTIKDITPVTGGKHSKVVFSDEHTNVVGMCFSYPASHLSIFKGEKADVLFTIDINDYNGKKTVQMIVKELRTSDAQKEKDAYERKRFAEIWSGAHFAKEEDILPTREDFAAVYCYVRHCVRCGEDELTHHSILLHLYDNPAVNVNYIKLKCIIRILQEMNVLGIDEIREEYYHFTLHFNDEKVDLEKSNILRRLRSQQL